MKQAEYLGTIGKDAVRKSWGIYEMLLGIPATIVSTALFLAPQWQGRWDAFTWPAPISRWWALLPIGAFVLWRFLGAAHLLQDKTEKKLAEALNRLDTGNRRREHETRLGFWIADFRALRVKKVSSDECFSEWKQEFIRLKQSLANYLSNATGLGRTTAFFAVQISAADVIPHYNEEHNLMLLELNLYSERLSKMINDQATGSA